MRGSSKLGNYNGILTSGLRDKIGPGAQTSKPEGDNVMNEGHTRSIAWRHTLTVALALAAACASAQAQQRNLTWSAGQASGGWYAQASGFAELVKFRDPHFNIKTVPGAAYGNMTKLQQGETELAWSLPPVIAAAYNGGEPYKDKQSDIRLVMTGLGFVHTQFCVAADSPVNSVREIFEKKMPLRIGTAHPGGSDEWELRKIFEFYKTTYADLQNRGGKIVFGSFTDMSSQYRARNIEAFILNNAVPSTDIEQASRERAMRILPMDEQLLKYLGGFGLVRAVVPGGSYKDVVNNNLDILTAAMANTIVTSEKVPAEAIYDFTKILLGNLDALRKIHPAFKDFDPKDAVKLANVPLHPGAEKAYREAGLIK
jgi:TRAP transporter TAXI family solute receptor